jgi:hypothetical protein
MVKRAEMITLEEMRASGVRGLVAAVPTINVPTPSGSAATAGPDNTAVRP